MKYSFLLVGAGSLMLTATSLFSPVVSAQESPQSQSSDSVAKPKKPADAPPPPEEAPIPSAV